jgi:dihydroorotate dehydrogenase
LDDLLNTLVSVNRSLAKKHDMRPRPLFVKLSPDLSWEELDSVLDTSLKNQIDGVISSNTTISRYDLKDQNTQETGGLSGRPIRSRSSDIIAHIYQLVEDKLPIIGVGGVFSADDVREKLDVGASLVQVYTGLVYEGPGLAGRILRELYH